MQSIINDKPVCQPSAIVSSYYDVIQLVHSGSMTTHDVSYFFYKLTVAKTCYFSVFQVVGGGNTPFRFNNQKH